MERKAYSRPVISAEQFAPQEFVAVCAHPEYWTAQCCTNAERGYIFFDYNENGIMDEDDRKTEGLHGGCHRTHPFPWDGGFPTYNAWVLKERVAHNYMFEGNHAGTNAVLREEDAKDTYLTPALVRRPGEALDGNWLVCYDLATVHHPS